MTELRVTTISSGNIEPHLLGVPRDGGKIQILLEVEAAVIDGEETEAITITAYGAPTALHTPELVIDMFDYATESLQNPQFIEAWERKNS